MKNLLTPVLVLILILSLTSCTGQTDQSAYSAILEQPPYKSLSDSLADSGDNDALYFRRAVLLNKNNLPEPALADFRSAWRLKKEEAYAIGIGNILLDRAPDSAVAFLQTAVTDLPESIYLRITLARAQSAANRIDDAIGTTNAILRNDSLQVNTLMLQYELFEKKKDTAAMIGSLQRAYRILPGSREISRQLAYQYAEAGDARALTVADSIIKHDTLDENPEPYYVKGLYFTNVKQTAPALKFFEQTIQHDHRFLNAYIEKGKIQLDQRQFPAALATFQLANRVSPAFPDAWYWMAMTQEKMGKKEDAIINYEKAYQLDKSFTEAKDAAAALDK